jgi:hypothetical protein
VKIFSAFCGNDSFVHTLKGTYNLLLSWFRWIHFIPYHYIYLRSFFILSSILRLGLPRSPFPYHFPKNIFTLFPASHMYHVPSQSQDPWLSHPNNIWVISINHLETGLHAITLQGVNFFRKRQKYYFSLVDNT